MILKINDFLEKLNEELIANVNMISDNIKLATIRVGDDVGLISFENSISRECNKIGILHEKIVFAKETVENEILLKIDELNNNIEISGILVFKPLDDSYNQDKILNSISIEKDIDSLNIMTLINLFKKEKNNVASTATATVEYLKNITNLESKNVLVINRSLVIGKPLSMMLIDENATVTIAHSKTKKLEEKFIDYDIIISAIGKAEIFKNNKFKDDAIIIDLGISKKDEKYCGDFEKTQFDNNDIRYLPSIGGIGKINSNIMIRNTVKNYLRLRGRDDG